MPMMAFALSGGAVWAGDSDHVRSGMQAIDRGRWVDARAHFSRTRDPVARDLYEWLFLTHGANDPDAGRAVRFLERHKDWPALPTLRRLAEPEIIDRGPLERVSWFERFKPATADAWIAYLDALFTLKRDEEARAILRSIWHGETLGVARQTDLMKRYGRFLTDVDHRRRLADRVANDQFTEATALAKILGAGYSALVRAQMALKGAGGNADAALAAVPSALRTDPGLIYQRIQWRRTRDDTSGAAALLQQPIPKGSVFDDKAWGREQMIIVRRLLEKSDYKTAYAVASRHPLVDPAPRAEAEWMAGWIALRFLKNPYPAFEHFERMHGIVRTPLSVSRATYWAGRASETLKDPAVARQWYRLAASYQTLFYGQLAAQRLSSDIAARPHPLPAASTDSKKAHDQDPRVRVARLLRAAGEIDTAQRFYLSIADHASSAPPIRLAIEETMQYRMFNTAVELSKLAARNGFYMGPLAYPVLDDAKKQTRIEPALAHAIIRQESAFKTDAKSSAGALGLMQLMPATAKMVSKEIGVRHRTSDLVSSTRHNILLGSTYLGDLVRRFRGSYILASAGYNAGPGRPARWVTEIGDPRALTGDALIDWIESVPIAETRNYIQRVGEGLVVYRSIMAKGGAQKGDSMHLKR